VSDARIRAFELRSTLTLSFSSLSDFQATNILVERMWPEMTKRKRNCRPDHQFLNLSLCLFLFKKGSGIVRFALVKPADTEFNFFHLHFMDHKLVQRTK
jgi:hypothetical protein